MKIKKELIKNIDFSIITPRSKLMLFTEDINARAKLYCFRIRTHDCAKLYMEF